MEKEYKRNFITNFIVRFDFDTYRESFDMDKISALFKNNYPLVTKNDIQDHQIVVNQNLGGATPRIEPTKTIHEVIMASPEQNTRIIVSNLAFVYESEKYTKFSRIKNEVVSVLSILEKEMQVRSYARFGIRYINLIKLPCKSKEDLLKWDGYINPELLQGRSIFGDGDLLQTIQVNNVASSRNDGIIYTIQTGIPNRNFPATLMEKNFLIDIDGFSKSLMEKDDIIDVFDDIHHEQKTIFENCIGDGLRSYMNE